MYDHLKDSNGDYSMDRLPADATITTVRVQIEPDTIHPINYVLLSDGTHWWNCDGSDLIWGPFQSREQATAEMSRTGAKAEGGAA